MGMIDFMKNAGEQIFGQASRMSAGNSPMEAEATDYTVQRGNTLSKIAKAHYGDASKYPLIFESNRPMLPDPDKIYPGQMLRLPG